jgi:hypothetical protein
VNCQRSFWHSHIKKTDKDRDWKKGKALNFGAAFAEFNEIFRGGSLEITQREVMRVALRNDLNVNDAAQLMACLCCYHSNTRSGEVVEKAEAWIEHPTLNGKVDKIISIDGVKYILEDKTSSDINEASLSVSLMTDPQLCLYASCAEQFDAKGIIYRVVEKPKERRKKLEGWFDYMERCTCKFLELNISFESLQIDEVLNMYDTAKTEIEAKKEEHEFLCNKQNCIKFGQACAWYSRCHGQTHTISNGDF